MKAKDILLIPAFLSAFYSGNSLADCYSEKLIKVWDQFTIKSTLARTNSGEQKVFEVPRGHTGLYPVIHIVPDKSDTLYITPPKTSENYQANWHLKDEEDHVLFENQEAIPGSDLDKNNKYRIFFSATSMDDQCKASAMVANVIPSCPCKEENLTEEPSDSLDTPTKLDSIPEDYKKSRFSIGFSPNKDLVTLEYLHKFSENFGIGLGYGETFDSFPSDLHTTKRIGQTNQEGGHSEWYTTLKSIPENIKEYMLKFSFQNLFNRNLSLDVNLGMSTQNTNYQKTEGVKHINKNGEEISNAVDPSNCYSNLEKGPTYGLEVGTTIKQKYYLGLGIENDDQRGISGITKFGYEF